MAINPITNKLDVYNGYDFESKSYDFDVSDNGYDFESKSYDFNVSDAGEPIQGKMILYTHRISDIVMQNYVFQTEEVKQTMAKALAEEMLKSGLIEFTKTHEPHIGEWVFRARIFAVPDDKVRILRQNGY